MSVGYAALNRAFLSTESPKVPANPNAEIPHPGDLPNRECAHRVGASSRNLIASPPITPLTPPLQALMALPDDDAAQREEQLKSALWYSLGQYIDDECLRQNWNVTPQFIGALTEMVFAQISKDLETFAAHAGRTTINTSDVLLLARRNDGLESVLKTFVDEYRAANGTSGGGAASAPRARAAAPSTRGKSVRGRRRGRGRGRGKS
ncbi:MHF histone-fold complex component [Coniosporium apollinis]|uniref:MHF histone-fold complex component n=1 Tax=Coniosporium apollinis TaxID=61459 RepID=A0ABQ9NPV2_9PEZI|nr:MHF histone-fold complex component [Coniosporium apollinis]